MSCLVDNPEYRFACDEAHIFPTQVLDMNELIKPRLEVEKKKAVEQAKKDATEGAIAQVKAKIKEQLEAEQAAKEAAEGEGMGN